MISLLISLLVFVLVVYIAFYLIGMMGLPDPMQKIVVVIFALIFLLYLLQRFGGMGTFIN
jgi:hypothetical protein